MSLKKITLLLSGYARRCRFRSRDKENSQAVGVNAKRLLFAVGEHGGGARWNSKD